jgi:hypothetical protein
MATKRNKVTLREQLEQMRHDFANLQARVDALELVAQRPKIARVIHDPSRMEPGGATQR